MSSLRALLRGVQPVLRESNGPVTWILGYHLVEGGTGLPIDMPKRLFLEHLRLLKEKAEIVPLSRLVAQLEGKSQAPRGAQVVLTFDDAFRNFYEVALPLLRERGLPATLFVPPGFLNGDGNHPLYRGAGAALGQLGPMTWDQVRECAESGIEIGSHTYRHTNLVRLPDHELAEELGRSQREIAARVGARPSCVCYPEGFVGRDVLGAAAGFYECGVVGGGRAIRPSVQPDLLALARLPVRADLTADDLSRIVRQSICLEEWAADKVRRLRGRVVTRA